MRPVLMITVAVLLACVAYSQQQLITPEFGDGGGHSALHDGMLMREARDVSESIRQKRHPKGNFDEIDLIDPR